MTPCVFETKQRSANIPEINSRVVSVRLQFCDKFKLFRDESSLIFFTPSSVNSPPHISSNLRFLKPVLPLTCN